jgi:hypothetical protein
VRECERCTATGNRCFGNAPLQTRYVHHGELTPAAPGCTVPGWRTKRGTLRKNGGHRRVSNPGLADWGMDLPTASRVVRLLTRLLNRSFVDWGMEPPTADRGVRLLPRLWNRSVADRTMDRGAVQDLFTADRCGLLSRAACTVNPGGRAKKARMRAIANCQWHSGSRQPRCHSEKRFHTGPGIWKE